MKNEPRPKPPSVVHAYTEIRAALDKIRREEARSTPWHERRDMPQNDMFV